VAHAVEARHKEDAQAAPAQLSSSEITTALVHLYRAEVTKTNTWRQRLDATTNWAVVTTAGGITFTLGDSNIERHMVILLTSVLVTLFLFLESRRYRHYDVWQTRVHLLESHFFAALLQPQAREPSQEWRRLLAKDLQSPAYHITYREAFGWRLRRSYVWIFIVLLLTWLAKLALHPSATSSWWTMVARAGVGGVPGWLVMSVAILFYAAVIVVAVVTWGLQTASGEVITPVRTREKIEHSETRLSEAPGPAE